MSRSLQVAHFALTIPDEIPEELLDQLDPWSHLAEVTAACEAMRSEHQRLLALLEAHRGWLATAERDRTRLRAEKWNLKLACSLLATLAAFAVGAWIGRVWLY